MLSHNVMLSRNVMLSCQALSRSAQTVSQRTSGVLAARRNLGTIRYHPLPTPPHNPPHTNINKQTTLPNPLPPFDTRNQKSKSKKNPKNATPKPPHTLHNTSHCHLYPNPSNIPPIEPKHLAYPQAHSTAPHSAKAVITTTNPPPANITNPKSSLALGCFTATCAIMPHPHPHPQHSNSILLRTRGRWFGKQRVLYHTQTYTLPSSDSW